MVIYESISAFAMQALYPTQKVFTIIIWFGPNYTCAHHHTVCWLTNAFGFAIQAYDPYVSESFMSTVGVKKADLEVLLKASDIVTIMCPYTEESHHLIDERALNTMRKHAVLLNCSRGKVVDNQALFKALSEGRIASAGLDDTEEEPAKMDTWSPDMNPLFTLDNCIITPHVAYISEDALQECRRVAAENARAVLLGQTPPNLVKP